jgi:hypothetical protein
MFWKQKVLVDLNERRHHMTAELEEELRSLKILESELLSQVKEKAEDSDDPIFFEYIRVMKLVKKCEASLKDFLESKKAVVEYAQQINTDSILLPLGTVTQVPSSFLFTSSISSPAAASCSSPATDCISLSWVVDGAETNIAQVQRVITEESRSEELPVLDGVVLGSAHELVLYCLAITSNFTTHRTLEQIQQQQQKQQQQQQ